MTKFLISGVTLALTGLCGPTLAATFMAPCTNFAPVASTAPANGEAKDADFKPVPVNALGCKRGVARVVDANTTIWRCPVELADGVEFAEGQPQFGFLIQRGGRPTLELGDDLMAGAFHNFDVINVNLDQSNAREHILAAWNGQSNGMGVHRWTIFAFDADWNLSQRFDDVADWGPSNLVASTNIRSTCDIAITNFENLTPSSTSLVLRARFYGGAPMSAGLRVPDLRLRVQSDRPMLERRYSRAFETQRTTWFSRGTWQWRGNVAAWLNNPATKALPHTRRPPPQ